MQLQQGDVVTGESDNRSPGGLFLKGVNCLMPNQVTMPYQVTFKKPYQVTFTKPLTQSSCPCKKTNKKKKQYTLECLYCDTPSTADFKM